MLPVKASKTSEAWVKIGPFQRSCALHPSRDDGLANESLSQRVENFHFSKAPNIGKRCTRHPRTGPNSLPGIKMPFWQFGHSLGSVSTFKTCFSHSSNFSFRMSGNCLGSPNKRRACCSFLRQLP